VRWPPSPRRGRPYWPRPIPVTLPGCVRWCWTTSREARCAPWPRHWPGCWPRSAAAVPAAGLLAVNLPAAAAPADDLPDYAPIPAGAFGPAVNTSGYYVGHIAANLYWVTDGVYQAMFLTTAKGVVVVDAPPTIGRNLLRAAEQAAAPVIAKYTGQLAGADVFTTANAEAMLNSAESTPASSARSASTRSGSRSRDPGHRNP